MFSFILERNNDLSNFFWPIVYYTKDHFFKDHAFPLWNISMLSGTPLLPDPQAPFFYPPNLVFLILPIDIGFILLIFLHLLIGSLGVFVISRKIFNLALLASIFTTLLFVFSPKMADFLEAGHVGLIYSSCFLPWLFLAVLKLSSQPNFRWTLLFTISASAIFLTHPIIFALSITFSLIIYLYLLITSKKFAIKNISFFGLGLLLTFGLISIPLLSQIEWSPETNRFLLLQVRDTYPKWGSFKEFGESILFPWLSTKKIFWGDSEKVLYLGILPLVLAIYGFLKLKHHRLAILILLSGTLLISLNNLSPIYFLLIKLDWFALMRVATRVWFVILFLTILLAGFGLDQLIKQKNLKVLIFCLLVATLLELGSSSYLQLSKPINQSPFLSNEGIQLLKSDPAIFRVFCLTKCISQKQAVVNNLELVDGYDTLIQKNYYQEAWQLTGQYWNYYSLSIPPISTNTLGKINPDIKSLGEYNTKYIIAPFLLTDSGLTFKKQIDNYYIYQNNYFQTRSNFPIVIYSPNFIRLDTTKNTSSSLDISLVYNPNWKAYLNGSIKTKVQQKPNALSKIDLQPDTKFVDFKYEPSQFKIGAFTILVVTIMVFLFTRSKVNRGI